MVCFLFSLFYFPRDVCSSCGSQHDEMPFYPVPIPFQGDGLVLSHLKSTQGFPSIQN